MCPVVVLSAVSWARGHVASLLQWGSQVGTPAAMGVAGACLAITAGLAQNAAPVAASAVKQATASISRSVAPLVPIVRDATAPESDLVRGVLGSDVVQDPARSVSRACSRVSGPRGCRITFASPIHDDLAQLHDAIDFDDAPDTMPAPRYEP